MAIVRLKKSQRHGENRDGVLRQHIWSPFHSRQAVLVSMQNAPTREISLVSHFLSIINTFGNVNSLILDWSRKAMVNTWIIDSQQIHLSRTTAAAKLSMTQYNGGFSGISGST
jgi:hypothetical protein